jgi:hypothetical protein
MRYLIILPALLFAAPAFAQDRRELWLYYPVNLQVAENVTKLEPAWRRAKQAGYTHVLLADSKSAKLGDVPEHYFKNVERAKAIARELDLKLVPALFSIGYSNDLLWHDPNLAEGLPVKDTPFVVGPGGVARVAPDPLVSLGKPAWKDEGVKLEGNVATVTSGGGNSRLVYRLKVPPFRCYHVSVKVKTDNFRPLPEVKALAGKWSSNWAALGVKPTQDWTEHHVVFNSLDSTDVNLYFGIWGDCSGTLQWKDWKVEEIGLVNVLRRPGTPCVVTGADGRVYEEGKDYEPIRDPRAGNVAWPGDYEVWHEPPALKTRLAEGTKLRVSWYHPVIIYDGQVSACIAEPKLNDLLADQAKRMKQAWGGSAAGWMMSHDEFRTLGWCRACQDRRETPGKMLAENVRYCRGLLRESPAYVWNDMFDPYHNAVEGPYYLVNGPWTGSWEGLEKDVVIMNWNHGQRDKSLKFFADRGNKQIVATYYDDADLSQTRDWLQSARDDRSVIGYMYTTWRGDYSKIEEFAKLCQGK